MAILPVAGGRRCTELVEVSVFDAGSDDATQFIGACVSSHPLDCTVLAHSVSIRPGQAETSAHDCRSGREWGNPICTSGGGIAIPPEVDNGIIESLRNNKLTAVDHWRFANKFWHRRTPAIASFNQ